MRAWNGRRWKERSGNRSSKRVNGTSAWTAGNIGGERQKAGQLFFLANTDKSISTRAQRSQRFPAAAAAAAAAASTAGSLTPPSCRCLMKRRAPRSLLRPCPDFPPHDGATAIPAFLDRFHRSRIEGKADTKVGDFPRANGCAFIWGSRRKGFRLKDEELPGVLQSYRFLGKAVGDIWKTSFFRFAR